MSFPKAALKLQLMGLPRVAELTIRGTPEPGSTVFKR